MKPQKDQDVREDTLEPIELGSAFEETRGGSLVGDEGNIAPNTRL